MGVFFPQYFKDEWWLDLLISADSTAAVYEFRIINIETLTVFAALRWKK